jgi:hypothetical protein
MMTAGVTEAVAMVAIMATIMVADMITVIVLMADASL